MTNHRELSTIGSTQNEADCAGVVRSRSKSHNLIYSLRGPYLYDSTAVAIRAANVIDNKLRVRLLELNLSDRCLHRVRPGLYTPPTLANI